MTLHGGRAVVTGRRSDASLYDFNLATYDTGDTFDQSLAKGFVELWGLPSKIAAAARPAARPATAWLTRRRRPAADPAVGRPVRRRPGRRAGARCRESTHFDWRLAPLRPRRLPGARPRAAPGRAARRRRARRACSAALDRARRRRRAPARSRRPSRDEDVHTALERGLLERLGALGGKLRAGRSRNDQVATDLRLYLRDHAAALVGRAVVELEDALLDLAERHRDVAAPGMTHLQHAQPVLSPTTCSRTCTRSPATSTGCGTGTSGRRSARSAPARWPARRCRSTRRRSPPSSASTGAVGQLDRRASATATSSPSSASSRR